MIRTGLSGVLQILMFGIVRMHQCGSRIATAVPSDSFSMLKLFHYMCDTIYLQAPTPIFQAPVVSFLDLRRSTSSAPETWSTSCGRLQILPPACILQAPAQCVCVYIYI